MRPEAPPRRGRSRPGDELWWRGRDGIRRGRPTRSCLRLVELHNRTNLDDAVLGAGNTRRHLDRVVEVLRLDEVVAAELLFRLDVRSVGRRELPVPHPDRGRGIGRLERFAADVIAV